MDWHFIAGKIMIDEKAKALVDHQFFHQWCTGAHGHGADHLTARRFGIENAAGVADSSIRRIRVSPVKPLTATSTK